MGKTFQEENNDLLEYILDTAFYSEWKDDNYNSPKSLELNISPNCNQNCKYCYLVKYKDSIYPKEIRDQDTIIKNMNLILNYLIERDIHPKRIDIFSGEIWNTSLGKKSLECIYDAIKNRGLKSNYIMIPSNMSFLMDSETKEFIENMIDKFKEIKVQLVFSVSVDGKILEEENRPFLQKRNNQFKSDDTWYDFLFSWCKKQEFAFHPMVAASGIEKWIDNYKWWNQMYKKFDMDPYNYGMYLEVRNDDWTLEKIHEYLKFLNFMMDYDYKNYVDSNLDNFISEAIPEENQKGYFPYVILDQGKYWGCGVDTMLIVRLGDLAIGPCHRTSYKQFIYGNYEVKNGKIIGLHAENIQLANMVLLGSIHGLSKCGTCIVRRHCLRGCLGAQFESTGEILQPIDSVCRFMKARIMFLYLKYKNIGAYSNAILSKFPKAKMELIAMEAECKKLKKGEQSLWKFWEPKIMNIINTKN